MPGIISIFAWRYPVLLYLNNKRYNFIANNQPYTGLTL